MKIKIIKIVVIFAAGLIAFLYQDKTEAKISLNQSDPLTVTLEYGYKGKFCQIPTQKNVGSVLGILTDFESTPSGSNETTCLDENQSIDIIVGNVLIDYKQGYKGKETFFIIDGKMYRAGDSFYSYYNDKSLGGTSYDLLKNTDIVGIEFTGSQFFFESEYQQNATDSAGTRLENSNYTVHFDEEGNQDLVIVTFEGTSYKRKEIINEELDILLLDYRNETQPTPIPDQNSDWIIFSDSTYGITFEYPSILFYKYGAIDDELKGYGGLLFASSDSGVYADSTLSIFVQPETQEEYETYINNIINNSVLNSPNIYTDQERTTIADIPAFTYDSKLDENGLPAPGVSLGKYSNLLLNREGFSYHLRYKSPNVSSQSAEFDRILSTFKFTDQTPTPTCMERPACLDATPRCLMPEPAEGWCP